MKQIIENLKSNREELISKYYAMKKEYENLSKDIQQARENGKDILSYKLSYNRSNLAIEISSVQVAINSLGAALNHLGESVDTFWGE